MSDAENGAVQGGPQRYNYSCPCCGGERELNVGKCDACFVDCPTQKGECAHAY